MTISYRTLLHLKNIPIANRELWPDDAEHALRILSKIDSPSLQRCQNQAIEFVLEYWDQFSSLFLKKDRRVAILIHYVSGHIYIRTRDTKDNITHQFCFYEYGVCHNVYFSVPQKNLLNRGYDLLHNNADLPMYAYTISKPIENWVL